MYDNIPTTAGTIAPKPVTPVYGAIHSIEAGQEHTFDLLKQLAHRLSPALRPELAPGDSPEKAEAPPESELVCEILRRHHAAQAINRQLQDVLDRLTV